MIRHCNWRWGFNTRARAHTYTRAHTHTHRYMQREGEERETMEKTLFFRALVVVRSPLLAWISRSLWLSRYLVGLLLSPMPDQGLSGGAETSRGRVISDNFSQETMRLCRSASSCRGNSAWEMVTWLAVANEGLDYFPRLTFLLINLCCLHVSGINSYLWPLSVLIFTF